MRLRACVRRSLLACACSMPCHAVPCASKAAQWKDECAVVRSVVTLCSMGDAPLVCSTCWARPDLLLSAFSMLEHAIPHVATQHIALRALATQHVACCVLNCSMMELSAAVKSATTRQMPSCSSPGCLSAAVFANNVHLPSHPSAH